MTELEVRTAGGIRVKKLGPNQTALIGPRDAVKAEVARMEAAHYPVTADRPQRIERSGNVVTVLTLLPRDQRAPAEPRLPWWYHPGWIVAVLLSATALIAVVWWVVLTLVSALVALAVPILGVLTLVALVIVVPKLGGGNRYTQIMNIRR